MSINLQQFSDDLAAAVEKAAQSTVTVDARDRFPATGILWSPAGEVLTADHVVQRDENVRVTLPDGRTLEAVVKGRDPGSDLALLKVEAGGLKAPEFAPELKVGHLVFAVGRPDEVQATLGSVVAVGGPVRSRRRRLEAYLQTDVTMYPGFSGGPLVDASGRVAGLNSSALARGASLTVPVRAAQAVVDALRQHGHVRRGFLGVATQPVMLPEDKAAELKQPTGLMIINVEKGAPADQAGLKQGDVLVALGDEAVADIEGLHGALAPETVGQTLTARVIRGGEIREFAVKIGARP